MIGDWRITFTERCTWGMRRCGGRRRSCRKSSKDGNHHRERKMTGIKVMEAGMMTEDGAAEAVDLEGGAGDEAEASEVEEGGEVLEEGDGDLHGAANRRNIRRTLTWGGVEGRIQELQVIMGTEDFGGQLKRVLYTMVVSNLKLLQW